MATAEELDTSGIVPDGVALNGNGEMPAPKGENSSSCEGDTEDTSDEEETVAQKLKTLPPIVALAYLASSRNPPAIVKPYTEQPRTGPVHISSVTVEGAVEEDGTVKVRTTATARKTKNAKQMAAKKLLLALVTHEDEAQRWSIDNLTADEARNVVLGLMPELDIGEQVAGGDASQAPTPAPALSPKNTVDYVSKLNEMVQKNKWEPLRYDATRDEVPFEITVQVGIIEATGTGRNKKLAKIEAAKTILEKIQACGEVKAMTRLVMGEDHKPEQQVSMKKAITPTEQGHWSTVDYGRQTPSFSHPIVLRRILHEKGMGQLTMHTTEEGDTFTCRATITGLNLPTEVSTATGFAECLAMFACAYKVLLYVIDQVKDVPTKE